VDRATRQAALWATAAAVPVAVLVAVLLVIRLSPDSPGPAPSPSPRPQATGPVRMAAPPLTPRAASLCRALVSQLPGAVRNRAQRPVTAGTEQNAAYGDPPITMACGVPEPSFPPTDLVYPLDAVCWHADESRSDVTVWTTVDREVPVQVTVPRSDDSPGQWTIAFASPIVASVPRLKSVPTGCGG
jgi:hypothetical protein